MLVLMRYLLHRPVLEPQGDLGTPTFPSCMRLPEPTVMGEALADDARIASPLQGAVESRATSPPAANSRVESPPRAVEAGVEAFAGYVGGTTSPRIIDVDPIGARPAGAEDLVRD
jgi:hypothetical protein